MSKIFLGMYLIATTCLFIIFAVQSVFADGFEQDVLIGLSVLMAGVVVIITEIVE